MKKITVYIRKEKFDIFVRTDSYIVVDFMFAMQCQAELNQIETMN